MNETLGMWDSGNCQSSVWQVISGVIKSYQCCVVQLVQRISYYWLLAPSWKTKSLSCRCSVCRWIFLALKYFDRYFLYRFWCRRTDERSNEPTSVCSSSASRNIYAAWKPLGCVCVCDIFRVVVAILHASMNTWMKQMTVSAETCT